MNDDAEDDDFILERVPLTLPSFNTAPLPKTNEQSGKSSDSGSARVKRVPDTIQSQVVKKYKDDDKPPAFYADTKGDWEVLSFGKIYQAEVPLYRRAVSDSVLGLQSSKDQKYRLEKSATETGAFELEQITKEHEFVSLTDQAALFASSLDKHPHKVVSKQSDRLGAFVPLEIKDEFGPGSKHFLEIQREYNEQLRTRPHDIALWLQFVNIQDSLRRDEDVKLGRQAIAERKVAILERAIKDNPSSSLLHHQRLKLLPEIAMPITEQMTHWDHLLESVFPSDNYLWQQYLHFCKSSVQVFLFTSVDELYGGLSKRPFVDHVALSIDYISFLFDTGYVERAIAILNRHLQINPYTTACQEEFIECSKQESFTLEEQADEWFKHEQYRERKFWFPIEPGKSPLYADDPEEDFERIVIDEEVSNFHIEGAPLLECLLTSFGLPPIHGRSLPKFVPLAWSQTTFTVEEYGHLLTRLPGMPLSLLCESVISLCWSLQHDVLGSEMPLNPMHIFGVTLPPAQLTFCQMALQKYNHKDVPVYLYILVLEHFATGKAPEYARQSLALESNNWQLHLAYARFLHLMGDEEEAWRMYSRLWRDSFDASKQASRWMIEIAIHHKDKELLHNLLLCHALDVPYTDDTTFTPAQILRGRQHFQQGTPNCFSCIWTLLTIGLDEAIKLTDQMDQCLKSETRVYILTVASYFGTREYNHRLQLQRDAIRDLCQLDPLSPAYFALAFMVEHKSMIEGHLRQHLHHTIEVYPQNPLPLVFAVFTELLQGQLSRTRSALEKATEMIPHEPFFWHWYLRIESILGDMSRLKVIAYSAIKSCPYAKDLYMTALTFLGNTISIRDKIELITLMDEKELRVRTLLEEFPLSIEDSQ